jgi:hypothetical protein
MWASDKYGNDRHQLSYTADLETVGTLQPYIATVPPPINAHKRPDLKLTLKS